MPLACKCLCLPAPTGNKLKSSVACVSPQASTTAAPATALAIEFTQSAVTGMDELQCVGCSYITSWSNGCWSNGCYLFGGRYPSNNRQHSGLRSEGMPFQDNSRKASKSTCREQPAVRCLKLRSQQTTVAQHNTRSTSRQGQPADNTHSAMPQALPTNALCGTYHRLT